MTVTAKDRAFKRAVDRKVFGGKRVPRKDLLRAMEIKRAIDAERKQTA